MFDSVFEICNKCNGQGTIDAYYYVNNGTCFKCGGSGKINKISHKPAEVLSQYQNECINKAKKEVETLGYFEMTDALSAIDFIQLTDIINQQKASLELAKTQSEASFESEDEWLELMGCK